MHIDVIKWVKGWRLDKLFTHTEAGEISVQAAAIATIDFLTKVLDFINSAQAVILIDLLGDSVKNLIEKAKLIIPEIVANLQDVQTLPDVAESLQNYKFSDDPKKDKIYHDVVTSASLIFSDGKLSISDAAFVLVLLSDFE